eukprot:5766239-Lingulodinium_polyedra.AAC.1
METVAQSSVESQCFVCFVDANVRIAWLLTFGKGNPRDTLHPAEIAAQQHLCSHGVQNCSWRWCFVVGPQFTCVWTIF